MIANAELLWMLAQHLALTALPAAAAALLLAQRGGRSEPLLLGIALAASGVTAYLAFWAYYAAPLVGETFSFLLVLASIQAIFVSWRRGVDADLLRALSTPALLWALGSAFVLYLGFLHGGIGEPLSMSATRFSHQLPSDNEIPEFFADWFYENGAGGGTPPLFADWLFSDRPPLQTGYALAQRPFGWDDSDVHYQVLGVVVQQLWIVGMWALLCAVRIRPLARSLAIFAAIVSDVAILHGFFVWPKLIAAAFLLGALAIVLSDDWSRLNRRPWIGALFGCLCALAMLAHGASAFGILALLLVGVWRGLPSRRWLAIGALAGLVLLAPWSAYQRFAEPPGNRLLKWHLGGVVAIDDRGTAEAIVDGYREAGPGGTLTNKLFNLRMLAGETTLKQAIETAKDEIAAGHWGRALSALRDPRFFSLLPLLGILLLVPPAMAVAWVRRRPDTAEWRFAAGSLLFCLLVTAAWVVLMFGDPDSSTMIHQGTLALPLVAVCGLVVGAFAVSRRLGIALVASNALLALVLYTPSLSPPPGTAYSAVAALLAGASLIGLVLVAFRPVWSATAQ